MNESAVGIVDRERPAREAVSPPDRSRIRSAIGGVLRAVAGAVPTVAVLAVAGAVGWAGHSTGWKLPKFSELNGEVKPADDWCDEHHVPESVCVECNPALLPRAEARGWCKRHGLSECVLCDPELAQLPTTPAVPAAELARADRVLALSPRTENNPVCRTHRRRIQFGSAGDAEKAGVAVVPVGTAAVVEAVTAPGEVGYDPGRIARLSSRSAGVVWAVVKHLGDPVKAGDVLALVDAPEVGRAKAELLQASATLQLRAQALAGVKESGGAVSAARVREAEAAVREADTRLAVACQALTNLGLPLDDADARGLAAEPLRAKLRLLGVPADVARSLDARPATANLLPVVALRDGVVVSPEVVAGEAVDTSRVLFEVVDPRSLVLTFDVSGEDARRLAVGHPVRFRADAGGPELAGSLAWVSTQADPRTRTVKARAALADPDGKQRANTFGAGRVILREEPNAVTVPSEAVQWEGDCHVVFVRDKDYARDGSPKVFHTRKVRVGVKGDATTEVVGVLPGEVVVTKGSGVLLAELLKGNIGEGCACHSHK